MVWNPIGVLRLNVASGPGSWGAVHRAQPSGLSDAHGRRVVSRVRRSPTVSILLRRKLDALDECLADLEWLPGAGYVLGVTETSRVLSDDQDRLPLLFKVLACSAEFWASEPDSQYTEARRREPTPFHVILHTEKQNCQSLEEKLASLGYQTNQIGGPQGIWR